MLQIRVSCPPQFAAFCLNCKPRKEKFVCRRILQRHFHTEWSPLCAGYTHLSELGDELLWFGCSHSAACRYNSAVSQALQAISSTPISQVRSHLNHWGKPQVFALKRLIDLVHARLCPVAVWLFALVHSLKGWKGLPVDLVCCGRNTSSKSV